MTYQAQWSTSKEPYVNHEAVEEILRRALRPEPPLTVSQWADKYRKLSTKLAAEPGPYRTDRTPYLREIMDALSITHPARKVVFMKGAQIGATEAGNNWLGYIIQWAPSPCLAVWPTVETAERASKQRIEPLIADTPELRELIPPARSRDSGNTVRMKEFPGGVLVLTGANSGVGLRSMPARFAFLDEIDAYPHDVDNEGDPVSLVANRLRTFGRFSKMFLVSTPTIKGLSRIEYEYQISDQRRFFIPCPSCGHFQWLKFERLRWEKGKPHTVQYHCEECEKGFTERYKTRFLHDGQWRATAKAQDEYTVGFHISALYSPVGWLSWREIAQQWEEAKGKENSVKAFKNTVQGETWYEQSEAPDWQRLYDRRDNRNLGVVPREALFLTAGADVQRERIEVHVWGWGRDMRSWLVDVIHLEGNTSDLKNPVWKKLTDLLQKTWEHETGNELTLDRLCIDTGDGLTTSVVYAWCRSAGGNVLALKGMRGYDRSMPVNGPNYVDVTWKGAKIKKGLQLWTVSVSVFKSETYRFLRLDKPTTEQIEKGEMYPGGFIHIPTGATDEWVQQLVSEQLVSVENKRTKFKKLEWHKIRDRNEALDCRVYARAGAWHRGLDRMKDVHFDRLEQALGLKRTPEEKAASVKREPKDAAKENARSSSARQVVRSRYMD